MLVILLDMKNDGASDLNFRQQVEVSQDEEHFALLLEVLLHVLLIDEEVVVHVRVSIESTVTMLVAIENLILAERPVSQRENIIPHLDDEERKVDIGELKVDAFYLADWSSCVWHLLWFVVERELILVLILTTWLPRGLVDRNFEFRRIVVPIRSRWLTVGWWA